MEHRRVAARFGTNRCRWALDECCCSFGSTDTTACISFSEEIMAKAMGGCESMQLCKMKWVSTMQLARGPTRRFEIEI
jgi:hypothetical protein